MKRIYLFVLTALMMLMSTSAMAQSETVKGDVNGDGVVDVADIAAVIKIMTNNGDIQKKYYWYVGQENPANMTSISPIVTDNTSEGWRLTGNSLNATYNYDTVINPITGSSKAVWYFALPENTGLGVFDAQNTNYAVNPISSVTIPTSNGVKYNIYQTGATRSFNAYYIKNK